MPLRDADLELCDPATEVQLQRDDRQALGRLQAEQLGDLVAVEEQLPRPLRRVVVAVALRVLGDVGADQPGLAVLDAHVGLGDVDLVRPDALDLGPGQHDARLEGVLDGVVVAGAPVDGDRLVGHRSWLLGSGGGHGKSRPVLGPALSFATPREAVLCHRLGGGVLGTTPSCTPPPFVAGDPSRWAASRQCPTTAGPPAQPGVPKALARCLVGDWLIREEGERRVEHRVGLRRRLGSASRGDVGLNPVGRHAVVLGREPSADRDAHAAVVLEPAPDLDRVLPEGRLADDASRDPVSWSAAATISDADADPPLMSTTTGRSGSVATPSPVDAHSRTSSPADSWVKISPSSMNWLAICCAASM